MKNTLADLNNHLFAQIERLSDEDLTPERLEAEVKRGAALVAVSDQVIRNGELQLRAAELAVRGGDKISRYLPMIADKRGAP